MKINKSQIARELEVDRRTVDKYINGFNIYCTYLSITLYIVDGDIKNPGNLKERKGT